MVITPMRLVFNQQDFSLASISGKLRWNTYTYLSPYVIAQMYRHIAAELIIGRSATSNNTLAIVIQEAVHKGLISNDDQAQHD